MAKADETVVDKIDATGVVESHLSKVLSLEEKSAARILKIYAELRNQLRDRLDSLPFGSLEAQHTRSIMAQVEGAILVLKKKLLMEIEAGAQELAFQGVMDTIVELKRFEHEFTGTTMEIDINSVLVADSTMALKLQQYQSSIDTYGQDVINRINNGIVQSIVMQTPYHAVVRQIAGKAGIMDFEAYRAERIARTELHSVYDLSRFMGLQKIQETTVPDLMKMSLDPLDHRTALDSIAVSNQIRQLDEPFSFRGQVKDPRNGKTSFINVKPFMTHPNRPNDRGATVPYRKAWEK